MITFIGPRDLVILAVDGTVPMGKINRSRERRYRSGMNILQKGQMPFFDTAAITPGTALMQEIDSFLRLRLEQKYDDLGCRRIIYSDHLRDGEGEHKIFDYYRSGLIHSQHNPDGAHVIYGMDADLILLCLLSDVKNIILAKDSVPLEITNALGRKINGQQKRRKDGKIYVPKNNNEYVLIDKLKEALIDEMGRPEAVTDFCFMASLVGNDFIPHPPTTVDLKTTIDMMVEIYKNKEYMTGPLTNHMTTVQAQTQFGFKHIGTGTKVYYVVWDNVFKLILALAHNEQSLLEAVSMMKIDNPSRFIQQAKTHVPVEGNDPYNPHTVEKIDLAKFRDLWYQNQFGAKDTVLCEFLGYPLPGIGENDISQMCHQYLVGMNWVLNYYTRGSDGVTWKWFYPYHHSPLIFDIAHYMNSHRDKLPDIFLSSQPETDEKRFTYIHQLAAVIPRVCSYLVPSNIHYIYAPTSSIIDLFPITFVVEKDGAKVDWDSISLIPFADHQRILNAIPNVLVGLQQQPLYDVGLSPQDYAIRKRQIQTSGRRGRGGRGRYR